jgi:hypothetical protein
MYGVQFSPYDDVPVPYPEALPSVQNVDRHEAPHHYVSEDDT